MIGIYIITNKTNGKSYIGQSVDIEKRFLHHKKYRRKDEENKLIYRAIRKYGVDNFSFEIIELCKKEELNEKEIYYIEKYGTFKNGYNMTKGGESLHGFVFKKKSIEKRAKSLKNYYKTHSRSIESREKVRKTLKDFYKNHPEKREEIGKSSRGRKIPKECVEKMKKTKRDNYCGCKSVIQKNTNGEIINEFRSIKIASKETKISASAISSVCRGKRKTAGGFIWEFKTINTTP